MRPSLAKESEFTRTKSDHPSTSCRLRLFDLNTWLTQTTMRICHASGRSREHLLDR
jgi:hypothetical protein